MPKPKKQPNNQIIQSLEELISDYSRDELANALASVEHDLSWKVLRAGMMKEYVNKMAYVLDNCSKSGKQIEAAYEAGVAQCLFDTANSLIAKYKEVLRQRVSGGVVEEVRPEE